MNKSKIIVSISAIVIVLSLVITVVAVRSTPTYAFTTNMNKLAEGIQKEMEDHSDLSYSSNPYDYIDNNQYYENIIKMKLDALPLLVESLENSEESGLMEYIMSIAIEEISGVDMESLEGEWSSGQEFLEKYQVFLRGVEDNVNVIMTSEILNEDEKVEALSKIGIYALPYIEEKKQLDKVVVSEAKEEIKKEYKDNTEGTIISNSKVEIIDDLVKSVEE